jgi:hypothetical protein
MKIKAEQAIIIDVALKACAKVGSLDKKVSHAIARNIHRLKPIMKEIRSAEEERIEDFALKNDNGEVKIVDGKYDFGAKFEDANAVYKDTMDREFEFDPFTIQRSENTDMLPPLAQAELFDIIIID